MLSSDQLQQLGEAELRVLAQELMARLSHSDSELQAKERKLVWSTTRIEQLTHEIAVLKRWKFSARSEQLDAAQKSLLDEEVDADIAAVELELESLRSTPRSAELQQPRRAPLPPHLPRTVPSGADRTAALASWMALHRPGLGPGWHQNICSMPTHGRGISPSLGRPSTPRPSPPATQPGL